MLENAAKGRSCGEKDGTKRDDGRGFEQQHRSIESVERAGRYWSIESFHESLRTAKWPRIGTRDSSNGKSYGNGFHHSVRSVRQSIGDRVGNEAQEASRNYQLLRGLVGVGRHVGGHFRHDVQRVGRTVRKMAVWLFHVRRVELAGRVLQHRFDSSSVLHQRGSILRDRATVGLSIDHDESSTEHHAERGLVLADGDELPAHLRRLVHHRKASRVQKEFPGRVRVPSEQTLCRD